MAQEVNAASTPSRGWKWIFRLLKFLLTVGLVVIVAGRIDWKDWKTDFREVRPALLIGASLMAVVNLWIQFQKWRYLVRILDARTTNHDIWGSLVCGFSVGLITPGRVGELGKGLFIPSIPKSQATGMSLLDKLFSQAALGFFGVCAMGYFVVQDISFPPVVWILGGLFGAGLLSIGYLSLLHPQKVRLWIRRTPGLFSKLPFGTRVENVLSTTEQFRKEHFLPSVGYGMLFQLILYVQAVLCVATFSEVSWTPALAAAAAAMFAKSLLPIAVMDIGVRESAMIYFFGLLSVSSASALNGSLLLFALNVLLPGVIGLPYVWRVKHPSI